MEPLYFFFNDTATTEIYTLSLHDALPIYLGRGSSKRGSRARGHVQAYACANHEPDAAEDEVQARGSSPRAPLPKPNNEGHEQDRDPPFDRGEAHEEKSHRVVRADVRDRECNACGSGNRQGCENGHPPGGRDRFQESREQME